MPETEGVIPLFLFSSPILTPPLTLTTVVFIVAPALKDFPDNDFIVLFEGYTFICTVAPNENPPNSRPSTRVYTSPKVLFELIAIPTKFSYLYTTDIPTAIPIDVTQCPVGST